MSTLPIVLYSTPLANSIITLQERNSVQCVLKKITILTSDTLEYALREANIHSTISHPNIIQYISHCNNEHSIDITLQYANKHSYLSQKISDMNVSVKKSLIKLIGRGLLQALEYLHSQNIVHADIRPENVLLHKENGSYTVKLCDFGLSQRIPKGELSVAVPDYYGTASYMAPEIKDGCLYLNSDMYSYGVFLYAMLTGIPQVKPDVEPLAWDLIKQCVCGSSTRISATAALHHAFFD